MVWEAVSERTSIIASHVDAMLDPDADLAEPASELIDAFIHAASEEADGTVLAEFLELFEDEIRTLLLERDVLPALEEMRSALISQLDG